MVFLVPSMQLLPTELHCSCVSTIIMAWNISRSYIWQICYFFPWLVDYNLVDQSQVDLREHTQYYGNTLTEFSLAVLSCIHQSTKLTFLPILTVSINEHDIVFHCHISHGTVGAKKKFKYCTVTVPNCTEPLPNSNSTSKYHTIRTYLIAGTVYRTLTVPWQYQTVPNVDYCRLFKLFIGPYCTCIWLLTARMFILSCLSSSSWSPYFSRIFLCLDCSVKQPHTVTDFGIISSEYY